MRHLLRHVWCLLRVVPCAVAFAIADIGLAADDPAPKPLADRSGTPLAEFPLNRVAIILAIVLLMAFLFAILFWWQKKIEQAGYFGRIYLETMKNIEATRLSAPVHADWQQGKYLNEIFLELSPRGRDWVEAHHRPEPASELVMLAGELRLEYEVRNVLQSMQRERSGTGVSETGGILSSGGMTKRSSRGSASGIADHDAVHATLTAEEKERTFWRLLAHMSKEAEAWIKSATACAWTWYQADLEGKEGTAQDRAEQALSVDFSALRGRGPEFVLEFTAVVVIIFAAVILGLVERLSSEQIGTLLAAIAGYVLGKGATRSRSGPGEEQVPTKAPAGGGTDNAGKPVGEPESGRLPDRHTAGKQSKEPKS